MKLSDYTFDELVELKNKIENYIHSYEDGFLYLCKVRSYGRVWTTRPNNVHAVSELCYQYNGDDGIVDVYTTNPGLKIHNYGDVFYIKSEEDYNSWRAWKYLNDEIPIYEKSLEEWENRDKVPFSQRPHFRPSITREMIDEYKKELENFDMSFVAPVLINEGY